MTKRFRKQPIEMLVQIKMSAVIGYAGCAIDLNSNIRPDLKRCRNIQYHKLQLCLSSYSQFAFTRLFFFDCLHRYASHVHEYIINSVMDFSEEKVKHFVCPS